MMANKLRVLLYAALVSLVSGCVSPAPTQAVFTPSQLNSESKRFNGEVVFVRGYVNLVPEGHILYESRELFDEFDRRWDSDDRQFNPKDYNKYCLTIANPGFLWDHRQVFRHKTVVLKGKFTADYLGPGVIDLGACPLPTGIIIDEPDLRARYHLN